MELIANIPDDPAFTRLDFGYVAHFSKPYTCWMQVAGRMYRGTGSSLQEAFDTMKATFDKEEPAFVQRQQLAKQDIKDIF